MPIYEYQCALCGEREETYQSIKEAPLIVCGACGMSTLRKVISQTAPPQFKGTGFYATDYAKKGDNK